MKKLFILLGLIIAAVVAASPQGVAVLTQATGIGSSSTQILARNVNRGYLIIQNESGANCTVAPTPIVSGIGLLLTNGQNYETVEAFTKSPWYATCVNNGSSLIMLETNY